MKAQDTKLKRVFEFFFKSNSIFVAMTPVIYLGGILGMTPFKYNFSSEKPKTLSSVPLLIISLFLLSVYFYCVTIVMNLPGHSFLGSIPRVFVYSELSYMICGFFTIVTIHVLKYWKRDFLANHFDIAEKLVEIFKILGCGRSYTSLKLKLFAATTLEFVFLVSLLVLTYKATQMLPEHERFPMIVVILWPSYTISLAQFMCSSFILITWTNLRTLNKAISEMQLYSTIASATGITNMYFINTTAFNSKTAEYVRKLDLIWKSYAYICKNSSNLNDYFSLIILAVINLSFLNTLFNAFFAIFIYSVIPYLFPPRIFLQIFILRIVRSLSNAVNLLFISVVCNICVKEASFFKFCFITAY